MPYKRDSSYEEGKLKQLTREKIDEIQRAIEPLIDSGYAVEAYANKHQLMIIIKVEDDERTEACPECDTRQIKPGGTD